MLYLIWKEIISFQVALLHHYRNCQGLNGGFAELGKPILEQQKAKDMSIYKYKTIMEQTEIQKILENMFKKS